MTWTLAGRYRLTSSVASGPTGELWRAVDSGTGHPVAVKVLHPYLAADGRVVDQLVRARRTLTELWHPGIARLVDVVVDDRAVGLVADFVPGTDLAQLLGSSGPLAPARAVSVAAAMANALHAAHHAGVVHGDLKPANVIVSPHGATSVRLTDFSVAALVRVGQPHTQWPDTSPYAPPWMIDGGAPTPSSDVHALGIVLHEMVTGTTSPADTAVQIDPRLRELVELCMQGNHHAPTTAGELAQRLQELAPHLPRTPAVRRAPPAPRNPPATTRRTTRSGRTGYSGHTSRADSGRTHHAAPTGDRERTRRGQLAVGAVAAIVIAAGTAAVVGILNQPAPDTPPADRSTTVAATEGSPTLPPEATEPSQEGGIAFVEYWFAALTHAVRSGDTAALAEGTSPECQQCQAAVETIQAVHGQGGSLRGGSYLVRNVSSADFWSTDRPVYDATVDRSARSAVDATGVGEATLPPLSFSTCTVVLEWTDERWRVREVVSTGCVS